MTDRTRSLLRNVIPAASSDRESSAAAVPIRSATMLLMHEELARGRMRDAQRRAELHNRGRRLAAARKWERRAADASRRADNASQRARLALATVV